MIPLQRTLERRLICPLAYDHCLQAFTALAAFRRLRAEGTPEDLVRRLRAEFEYDPSIDPQAAPEGSDD